MRPTTPIKEVARSLVEHRINGMPVVDDDGRIVGVVSEGDLIVKEQGKDAAERRPLARIFGDSPATHAQLTKVLASTAGDAMTAPAITFPADALVVEAAAIMTRKRINRLPAVEGDVLVGVVSRADVVRAFVRSDKELATAIRDDVLNRTLWLDPFTAMVPGVTGVATELTWELDDRQVEAPERDLVSRY